MTASTPMGVLRGPLCLEVSNLDSPMTVSACITATSRGRGSMLLFAHVVVISLGLVVEASGVLNGDHITLLREILSVARLEKSLGHTHLAGYGSGMSGRSSELEVKIE